MSRKINVKTIDVIDALKKNQKQHIKDYEKAKILYKETGLKFVEQIKEKLEKGELGVSLCLVEPIDKTDCMMIK